jgi:DNA-binding beta-propeller fold protein YncE/cytochrome c
VDAPGDLGTPDAASPTPEGRRRFPLGSTYYLPAGTGWTLASAPAGNLNALFTDPGSQRSAFVPHVAGEHRFTQPDGTVRVVNAVDPGTLAFHNLNYFPTHALALEGDTVYVAGVLRPELIALDRATLAPRFAVPVGSWPVAVAVIAARNEALVASRGEDSLTVVDLGTRRPVRSIWVGDEVASVVVTSDGMTAVVALPNDRKVAFVDLQRAAVVGEASVGVDPTHLALTPDGQRVYVAGRRTGDASPPEPNDPRGADISEVSVARRQVDRTIHSAGVVVGGLAVSPDGRRLFVSATRVNAVGGALATESDRAFRHTLVAYDVSGSTVTEVLARDVTRSIPGVVAPIPEPPPPPMDGGVMPPSDGGTMPIADAGPRDAGAPTDVTLDPRAELNARRLVALHGLAVRGNDLWVTAEATDLVLRFDATTLIEQDRYAAPGRPRALTVGTDGTVYAYGHQGFTVTAVTASGMAFTSRTSAPIAQDPRPEIIARGMSFFTGPGLRTPAGPGRVIAGDTWSCSSCHTDGLSDLTVWQAGPIATHRYASRAFNLLEGTWPLGWQGYLSNVVNYSYTVTGNIGVAAPTQSQVDGLAAYLASLMAPPAANTHTQRDGALSPEAQRGAAAFTTRCASCHGEPLTTNRSRIAMSITDSRVADTPSLLGTYRNGAWFRRGEARTLDEAVGQMATWVNAGFTADDLRDVTRYVRELTGREFFALTAFPHWSSVIPATGAFEVSFSMPVFNDASNLARVRLLDASGREVAARITATRNRVTVTPMAPLQSASSYQLVVNEGFESESEVRSLRRESFTYRTANAPALALRGRYTLQYTPISFGAPGVPAPRTVTLTLESDAGGAVQVAAMYVHAPLTWRGVGVIDGRTLRLPPMPLPVGGSFADGFSGFEARLEDTDGDGTADRVSTGTSDGGTRGYTMAGPGFEVRDLPWDLTRIP